MSTGTARVYCSELAQQTGAELAGSAEPVDVWLMLEYAAVWKARALDDNELPAEVNSWLTQTVERVEQELHLRPRLQLIRQESLRAGQPEHGKRAPFTFAVAFSREFDSRLYRFDLAALSDLQTIDIAGLLNGTAHQQALVNEPMYLVCTNGQRDLCCARFGLPLYERLQRELGGRVWQTTHIGGHRYAPNLVCLPDGVVYGFAHPELAMGMVAASAAGEVDVEHLRGRSCYDPVAQFAEVQVRRDVGVTSLRALRLSEVREVKPGQWRVTFLTADGTGRPVPRQVLVEQTEAVPVQASCGERGVKSVGGFRVLRG